MTQQKKVPNKVNSDMNYQITAIKENDNKCN